MNRWRCLALGTLVLASGAGAAEPVVDVELPAARLAVGDLAPVTLVVDVGDAVLQEPPRFPAWGESWGGAEVVAVDEPVRAVEGGRVSYRQRIVLQAFRPGEVTLPPVEIAVPLAGGTRRVTTGADLALSIASVLPPGAEGDGAIPPPQPAAPPRPLPLGTAFWATTAIGTALVLAVLLPMLRRRRAEAAGRRPALAPLPELVASLAAARSAESAADGHARVSLALRRYLGRRLSFPAAESTTSEIQRQLLARHLPPGLPKRGVELLRACDLVKFARRPTGRPEVERWAAEAEQVATAVEAHLTPADPTRPQEAAA